MTTKADFYVGRGPDAEWIGSLVWDVYPEGLPTTLIEARSEQEFREELGKLLEARPDSYPPSEGWPWPWDNSITTPYVYAFEDGVVWGSYFGSSWWLAKDGLPDPTTLKSKATNLPDMSLAPKIQDRVFVLR